MNNNKTFIVTTKCGHVGKNNYIVIDFAVKAETAKEAARKARHIPRVKHDWKDAIIEVKEVTFDNYLAQVQKNVNDGYLNAKSVQEQRISCENLYSRIEVSETVYNQEELIEKRIQRIIYKQKKLKLSEKYNWSA